MRLYSKQSLELDWTVYLQPDHSEHTLVCSSSEITFLLAVEYNLLMTLALQGSL